MTGEGATMNAKAFARKAMIVLSLVMGVAVPVAAQGVGAIGGTITDASGGVLPGATVTLANPGTIGGNQSTTSDERGAYQFSRLVPVLYTVRGELLGFSPAAQEDVVVI